MRGSIQGICCLVLVLTLVQGAWALSTSAVKVIPAGDLKVNDAVTVNITVSIPRDYAYDLEMTSALKSQRLTVTKVSSGGAPITALMVVQGSTGNWFMPNWLISDKQSYQIQVEMRGTVDSSSAGKSIILLRIAEKDVDIVVSEVKVERNVFNPGEITPQITAARSDAGKLLQNITAAAASNISTTAPRAKYDEAINLLNQADAAKTSNFTKAQSLLTSAKTAITDGSRLLEKAIVQRDIDSVETIMDQVDTQVAYFKVNRSISTTDPRLLGITSKYDAASTSISMAKTSLNEGNTAMATTQTADAKMKAQEALNLSANLRKEIGEGGFSLPGINPLYLLIGVGIIVIGAAGVLLYRKYFRWDELG